MYKRQVNTTDNVLLDQLSSVDQSLYQDNTYTNIYSTITQPPAPPYVPPVEDEGEDVPENTVESIVGVPTDGQGGVGQNVYTWWGYNGEYGQYVYVNEGYGYGYGSPSGGGVWYWDQSDVTWKHK